MDDLLAASVSDQAAGEVSPLVGFRQRRLDNPGIRGRFQRKYDKRIFDARFIIDHCCLANTVWLSDVAI